MYLKKIITNGFKSFADRVTVTLEKRNITGIVGPNGSGKSNIIDAVRWVMGEQNSKMLRGEKSTDIIFSGSEKRKALGMAEVSLVFDNGEKTAFCPLEYRHEDEITITRRIYIDGSREYFINRKPARLKDVSDFFVASSLGSRSYSMIQQGQVDRILQAKPEEIREIIEEAAGTIVFKKRYIETQKKIDTTKINLSRIEDILREIDKQLDGLKEQVESAKRWQVLTDSLKEKELSILAFNAHELKTNLNVISQKIEEEASRDVMSTADIAVLERDLFDLQKELEKADPTLKGLQEDISDIREKLASQEASLTAALSLTEGGDQDLSSLQQEFKEDEENLHTVKDQAIKARKTFEDAQKKIKDLEGLVDEYQYNLDMQEEQGIVLESKIDDYREEIRSIEKILDNNLGKIEFAKRNLQKSLKEKGDFAKRLIDLEQEHSQDFILADSAQVKVSTARRNLDRSLDEKNQLDGLIHQRDHKIKEDSLLLDQLKESYLEKKAHIVSLDELIKNSSSVKSLLSDLRQKHQDIDIQLLSDSVLFNSEASHLPKPVIAAFEAWAERLIFPSLNDLNTLCNQTQEGDLALVPISIIGSQQPLSQDLRTWVSQSKAQTFTDFLKIEQKDLLEAFLSKIFYVNESHITDHMLQGLELGAMIITRSGQVLVQKEHIWLGGSQKEGSISYKAKLLQDQELLTKLEDKLNNKKEKYEKILADQENDRKNIDALNQKILDQNKALLEAISEMKNIENQLSHKQDMITSAREEFKSIDETYEKVSAEVAEFNQNNDLLSKEKKQAEIALASAKEDIAQIHDEKQEWQRQLEQKKIDMAAYKSKAAALEESFVQSDTQYAILSEKLEKRQTYLNTLSEKIKLAHTQKGQLEESIKELLLQREAKQAVLIAKQEENSSLVSQIKDLETRLKLAWEMQQKAKKTISEKEFELEKSKYSLDALKEQAFEKYQIDIETFTYEFDEDFNVQQESKEAKTIRTTLDNYGPINMIATREYEELEKRQKFISENHNEVVLTMELLETAIEEIQDNSRQKFLTTLDQLKVEFRDLFPILFPGGEGEIILTDPNDALNSGVELMVRLPGKKQQNMRLFSGGEKALTAIALIFALLKSNPTPFCFLDEVDAPLDETNVGRYNRVLEALSKHFQFIVITHRRRTMEVLDTLYGVTMQEPGVSKVVGVDLTKSLPVHLQKAFKEKETEPA